MALHSNLSDTERVAAWLAVHEGRSRIVVGTRLAVFCSMPQLSIIVVDEEHDPSYKAGEGVRYSARDLAVKRAQLLDIPIVLGSATPSIESWALAQTGRYRLLQLAERVGLGDPAQPRPSLELIDGRLHKPQNGLSAPVAQALTDSFDRGEQALGISKPSWLCAGGDMRIVRLAIELPTLLDVCGVPQAGSVAALPSLRIRCPGSTRLPHVRQSALEGRGPGHTAYRRNTARLVAGSKDCSYRSRLHATASCCEESARCGACGRSRCARRHADDREGARFSARFAGRCAQSRWSAGVARLPCPGAIVCDTDAGFGPRGANGAAEPCAGANAFSTHPLFAALGRHDYAQFAQSQLTERQAAHMPPATYQALMTAEARTMEAALDFLRAARDQALQQFAVAASHVRLFDPVPMSLQRLAGVSRAQLLIKRIGARNCTPC